MYMHIHVLFYSKEMYMHIQVRFYLVQQLYKGIINTYLGIINKRKLERNIENKYNMNQIKSILRYKLRVCLILFNNYLAGHNFPPLIFHTGHIHPS